MSKKRLKRTFTQEFKEEAIKLAQREGNLKAGIALGISELGDDKNRSLLKSLFNSDKYFKYIESEQKKQRQLTLCARRQSRRS